ncbi:MAG TPA: Na+/H+ antiporter NhaA [Candidatus Anaerobiospirillum stercoravium]|nr:Na+/H+ antiporter NhaA [Candidatus Anaerobiospirillum stercoravium]
MASGHVISPLQSMEDKLHVVVNYLIMPLFAFANAGITLTGAEGASIGQVTFAVLIGLVLGKFVGIFLFTFLAVKSGLTVLPTGVTWKQIAGVALLGGIGFTVALFIANLSFSTAAQQDLLNQAKLGILLGTICAGILGYIVLRLTLPKEPSEDQDLLAH